MPKGKAMNRTIDKVTYILRYYLALDPTYNEKDFYARADEMIDFCLKNGVDAVMLYVDLDPNWYYAPDSLEHTAYYAEKLIPVAEKLRENGISYQLNYQNLIGAWDGGADLKDTNRWEYWTDQHGDSSSCCACNVGKKFREIAGKKLTVWAKTKPDAIWIDDDIRFHNHRTSVRRAWSGEISKERLDFGCFCDEHIKLFNERNHTSYSREEITLGITSGGDIRQKWLEFSKDMADDLAGWIEKTVHSVSPDTRIAVMTSAPDAHSVEGRDWKSFLSGLSGEHMPMLRPTFGPYAESNPRDFFSSYLAVEQLKANIVMQYGIGVDFCPEIENTRFTCWSKSVAATRFQLMLSAYLGCRGITLSIFDLEGCRPKEEPQWGQMLRKSRPFAEAMAQYDFWDWENDGIALITAPDRFKNSRRKACDMSELVFGRLWDDALIKTGIPVKYVTPDRIKQNRLFALDSLTVDLLDDAEAEEILSKGAVLDAGAAQLLIERGFADMLGIKIGAKVPSMANVEVLNTVFHSDSTAVRIPSRINGNSWNEITLNGAEQISTLITPCGEEYPGFTKFNNKLGGTVYVYAGNGALGDGFYSDYRVKLIKSIVNELSDGIAEVNNRAYALTISKSNDGECAVFVANMTADLWKDAEIKLPYNIASAEYIDVDGKTHKAETDSKTVRITGADLHLYDCVVCLIKKEKY